MNLKALVKAIVKVTKENQGCSINLEGHSPKSGYMVAQTGAEYIIPVEKFNNKEVKAYIKKNKNNVKGAFIGTWINEGLVYLDISNRFKSQSEAIKKGIENKQLGIFNLNTFETITIEL